MLIKPWHKRKLKKRERQIAHHNDHLMRAIGHRYHLLAQYPVLVDQHVCAVTESETNSFSCKKNNNKHVEGSHTLEFLYTYCT